MTGNFLKFWLAGESFLIDESLFYYVEKKSNGTIDHNNEELKALKRKERDERHKIVLWRRPLTTIKYFLLEFAVLLHKEKEK